MRRAGGPAPAAAALGGWARGHGGSLLAAALLLLVVVVAAQTFGFRYLARPGEVVGPATWPRAILALLAVLAAVDILADVRARRRPAVEPAPADPGAWEAPGQGRDVRLLAAGIALMTGYVALVVLAGFLLATALFVIAFSYLGGWRRPVAVVSIGVVSAYLVTLLFVRVVYIALPLGVGPMADLVTFIYQSTGIFA